MANDIDSKTYKHKQVTMLHTNTEESSTRQNNIINNTIINNVLSQQPHTIKNSLVKCMKLRKAMQVVNKILIIKLTGCTNFSNLFLE